MGFFIVNDPTDQVQLERLKAEILASKKCINKSNKPTDFE
jgi:hypothetical protein